MMRIQLIISLFFSTQLWASNDPLTDAFIKRLCSKASFEHAPVDPHAPKIDEIRALPRDQMPTPNNEIAIHAAECLVPRDYKNLPSEKLYQNHVYLQRMGQGILLTQSDISQRIRNATPVSIDEIRTWQRQLAVTRGQAEKDRFGHPFLHGLELPDRPEEMGAYLSEYARRSGEPFPEELTANPEKTFRTFPYSASDQVAQGSTFERYYDDAEKLFNWQTRQRSPYRFMTVGGQRYPLSRIDMSWSGPQRVFYVAHPNYEDSSDMRAQAYKLIQEVINSKEKPPKAETLNQLARAHFLLMHATPFTNGSPSIVESLIESILQAKFEIGLPKGKFREPFWQAMFWDVQAKPDFTWDDLMSCYRESR